MRNAGVAFTVCLAAALSLDARTGQGPDVAAPQIPFSFEHNEIIVQATIEHGGPFAMLLDTDTNPSVVSLALAQSSGLPLKDLQAIAIDLAQMSSRLGAPIDGVLGHNFLSGNVVEIDYPNRLLRLGKRSPLPGHIVASLPFRYDDESSSLVVDGVLVNGKKMPATIDTGSDGGFKLTPAAVESLGLTEAALNGTPDTSVGYMGTAHSTLRHVDEIVIGDIGLHSVDVVFFDKGTGRDRKPWAVNIGNGFLRDYIVTVDYPRKRITIPRP
jgi:hypothetical protein